MIPIHLKMIFPICTFLVLFQTSHQFVISFDTSEGSSSSSSSSSSSEESPNLQKDIQKLSPDQQKELTRQFLNHLLAISHMQADERKIEHEILEDLTKIPNFENDALAAIKKFRRALDEGRKTLDKIVEQRKGKLNPKDPEIMRHYEGMWVQIESKKCNEAKAALENIDAILSHMARSVKNTIGDQVKTLQGIQQAISERKKKVDQESKEIRQKVDAVRKATKQGTTAPPPDALNTLFLFDENDVKRIREIYNNFMTKLPKLNLPQSKNLLQKIEQSGMPLPLFCKSLAEMHVIKSKAIVCEKKGDKIGRDVLLQTLNQPNYKKTEEIMEQSPPPSLETVAKEIRKNFFNLS